MSATTASPARDPASAALAPVQRALNRISGLMPTWAWAIFWLVLAVPYGLYGDTFNDSLYESSSRRWPT